MSLLTDSLPLTTPHGYRIVADFRFWMKFDCALARPLTAPVLFIRNTLADAYPFCAPQHLEKYHTEYWDDLLWFYRCGRSSQKSPRHGSGALPVRAYDYEQDAALILAAFQQAYSLDLTQEQMHWWRFRALFEGLPADCRICKVMEYRTADTSDMPEKARVFYQKMQARYRLKQPTSAAQAVTVEDHNAAFIRRLTGR